MLARTMPKRRLRACCRLLSLRPGFAFSLTAHSTRACSAAHFFSSLA
jgi:hypothetical protein